MVKSSRLLVIIIYGIVYVLNLYFERFALNKITAFALSVCMTGNALAGPLTGLLGSNLLPGAGIGPGVSVDLLSPNTDATSNGLLLSIDVLENESATLLGLGVNELDIVKISGKAFHANKALGAATKNRGNHGNGGNSESKKKVLADQDIIDLEIGGTGIGDENKSPVINADVLTNEESNAGDIDVGVIDSGNSGQGDIIGASVAGGNESGQGGVAGVSVLDGDNSGSGGSTEEASILESGMSEGSPDSDIIAITIIDGNDEVITSPATSVLPSETESGIDDTIGTAVDAVDSLSDPITDALDQITEPLGSSLDETIDDITEPYLDVVNPEAGDLVSDPAKEVSEIVDGDSPAVEIVVDDSEINELVEPVVDALPTPGSNEDPASPADPIYSPYPDNWIPGVYYPNDSGGWEMGSDECMLDTDGDGVCNKRDLCPNTLPGVVVLQEGCAIKEGVILDIYTVQFDYDSHLIKPQSKMAINMMANAIKSLPETAVVEIGGHADSIGSEDYNMSLSEKRAGNVLRALAELGVNEKALVAVGYGESMPIAKNTNTDGSDNPEGRSLNRRVTLQLR